MSHGSVTSQEDRRNCGFCALQMALTDDACVDVTYEDPAEALQALRERLDCERAAQHADGALLAEAQACVRAALAAAAAGPGSSGAAAAEEAEDGGALWPMLPGARGAAPAAAPDGCMHPCISKANTPVDTRCSVQIVAPRAGFTRPRPLQLRLCRLGSGPRRAAVATSTIHILI